MLSLTKNRYYSIMLPFFSIECTAEDAAGNFKALAKRNGIKVTSPSGEPDETNGAPVGM